MVFHHVGVGELVEELHVADDWLAAMVTGKGGRIEESAIAVVWIVQAHINFSPDDIFFFFKLFYGKCWLEDHFEENSEESLCAFTWAIDVVNGAIEGGVGIPFSARSLDGIGKVFAVIVFSSFENHMFKKVGYTCAQEASFVNTARLYPCLCADHGCLRVGIEDEIEAVLECVNLGACRGEFHVRNLLTCFLMCKS